MIHQKDPNLAQALVGAGEMEKALEAIKQAEL